MKKTKKKSMGNAASKHDGKTTRDKAEKTPVRRLLTAVDRLINAAKQAERARDDLKRSVEGKDE